MAKSTRPDRKKNDRRREPKEFEETTLSVDRVTRVVAGGRRLRFRAVVVVGDKKGKVGLGTGKANEVQSAIEKATTNAKRNMIKVPILRGTLPHEVDVKFKAARIRLLPASEGTGVIAGGALRTVLEHAGVKDVLSKRYGTTNKLVNAQCVIMALQSLHEIPAHLQAAETEEQSADAQPKEEKGKEEMTEEEVQETAKDGLEVKEVSQKDIDEEGNLVEKS